MNISDIQTLIDSIDDIIYGSIKEQATGMQVCEKLVALQSKLYDELDGMLDAMEAEHDYQQQLA